MKRFLLTLIFTLIMTAIPAHAQLLVEDGKIRLNVDPNQTIIDAVVVHNTTSKPVQVKAYWEDFIYTAPFKGEKDFFPSGTGKYSCASWINFMPRDFVIPPYGKQSVDYTIKVPTDAKGGYYGVLFFENSEVQHAAANVGVNIVTRVGSLVFLETKDKNKTCRVEDWKAAEKGFSGKFVNQGNVFLLPQGVYYVLDSGGMALDRGDIERAYLPPDEGFGFQIPYPKILKSGNYQMIVTFDLEDEVSKVFEIEFSKDDQGKIAIKKINE